MNLIDLMDYSGVAFFAATGSLVASRKQLDIIGFLFFGAITGLGGGTVRDLILDVPVFWVEERIYVLACSLAAVIVYFTAHLIESRYRLLLWLDAIALAAYGSFGAYKGYAITQSPVVAVIMGMFTGTLGGIIRDVIAGEPSILMRQEVYVAAAMIGGVAFVATAGLGISFSTAAIIGFCAALCVRGCALYLGWSLPVYKSRPGRDVGGLR